MGQDNCISLPLTVLVLEDNPADFGILRRRLQQIPTFAIEVLHCEDAPTALDRLSHGGVDCLFLDYQLGAVTGLDVLRTLRAAGNDIPVIAFTGSGNESVAVELMKEGAQDYLSKAEASTEALQRAFTHAIDKARLVRQVADKQRELEQFVQVAAHDLKAPLRRTKMFGQLLKEEADGMLPPQAEQYLDIILTNTVQMQGLIEALLAYAQLGRSSIALEPVNLATVMENVRANLESVVLESGCRLEIRAMPTVLGDATALLQLFQNLIGNALKFRGEDPPIIQVSAHRSKDTWQILIQDNGIGIPAQQHERIFEAFTRLQRQDQYEGSGIGLAICKKIVDQHRGQIWVTSEPGQGATFHCTLQDGGADQAVQVDIHERVTEEPRTVHLF